MKGKYKQELQLNWKVEVVKLVKMLAWVSRRHKLS